MHYEHVGSPTAVKLLGAVGASDSLPVRADVLLSPHKHHATEAS